MSKELSSQQVKDVVAYLDRRGAANYLAICERKLDQYASAGELARIKLGRRTIFQISELDRFAKSKIQRLKVEG